MEKEHEVSSVSGTEPCGFCGAIITLSVAQHRWKRFHPTSHVFCGTRCCNRYYQRRRQQQPGGRQAEYQRSKQHRSGIVSEGPGVIHATDQDYLGGGWSWVALPSYAAYRCTCRPAQPCDACRTWRG